MPAGATIWRFLPPMKRALSLRSALIALSLTAAERSAPCHANSIIPGPTDLIARAAFATEVDLSWSYNYSGATWIIIQRSTDGVHFSNLVAVSARATTYIDSHISPSTTYTYRAFAAATGANSVLSNTAQAQTSIAVITDPYAVFSEPNVSKPVYQVPWIDPVFGTKITRIADDPGVSFSTQNVGAGSWSSDARHEYQLIEPWSTDESLYFIENETDDGGVNGGAGGSLLNLSGSTYLPMLGPPTKYPDPAADERWNPNPLYATQVVVAGDTQPRLWWFDIVGNAITRVWPLPFVPQWIGGSKGNVSQDGRYVALTDLTQTRVVIVDMDPQSPYAPYPNRRIGPIYKIEQTISGARYGGATASVDPSGQYLVLHYSTRNGVAGEYIRVFDIDPATLAISLHPMPSGTVQCTGKASDNWIYSLGHYDLSIDFYDNNEPVIVGQEACGNVGRQVSGVHTVNSNGIGHVVKVRLRDGSVTSLTDPGNYSGTPLEAFADHVSAENQALPGWVFVTYGPWPGEENYRYYDEVIAVSLDGKQRVQRLAHLHSDFDRFTPNTCSNSDVDFDYRSEPHGVPAPDGKRLAFASNWLVNGNGTGGCSIQDYVVDWRP